jgi:hypothetical protein
VKFYSPPAYVIAATILIGYWSALWRRARRGRKSVSGEGKT